MDSVIRSKPLLLKRNVRYTQIAVHQIQAAKKVHHVLFIGTGKELHTRSHTCLPLLIAFCLIDYHLYCVL